MLHTRLSVVLPLLLDILDVFLLVDVLEDQLAADEVVSSQFGAPLQDHLSSLCDVTRPPQVFFVEMPSECGAEGVVRIDLRV